MAILNAIGEPKPYVQDVLSNNLAAGTFLASRDKSRLPPRPQRILVGFLSTHLYPLHIEWCL